jgi:hypothetical protein
MNGKWTAVTPMLMDRFDNFSVRRLIFDFEFCHWLGSDESADDWFLFWFSINASKIWSRSRFE